MSDIVLDYSGQELNEALAQFKANYKDTSRGNITKDTVLEGQVGYNAEGEVIGEMPDNGTVNLYIDGITETSSTIPKGYHDGEGSVSLTDDIANEVDSQSDIISQIKSVLQGKAVGDKQEQSKELNVTENGSYVVKPDEGFTLSGVDVNVDVADDFTGIKYFDFTGMYTTPKIADMRSLSSKLTEQNENSFAYFFANTNANGNGGFHVYLEEIYLMDGITVISNSMFYGCGNLHTLHGDLSNIWGIFQNAFTSCKKITSIPYMPLLRDIRPNAFKGCGITEIKLPSGMTNISNTAFNNCPNIIDIYCGFAEGAIANAPWGATNATIHYNTQYDADGNPITT